MGKIGFIRHGVTAWNQEGRAQGQHDVPLNDEGIAQARKLAKRLANEDWEYIYSSDLQRAAKTAELIAQAKGIEVVLDARLREKSHGRLDGTTVQERVDKWGSEWQKLDHGQERDDEVWQRASSFLEEIVSKHPEDNVLIVSHGAWIRTALSRLVKEEQITYIENTSLCVLEKAELSWNCLLLACTAHLNSES
ncbi:histidine phosphatase family protein [Paenibacillus senegalensis]|uniref:histidine phosphatase family protein n=1 Tax=Paenibacillus senegalensis TaxID=1465766 RepID=UPI00028A2132|nr:histidine phosphatase family protein [Paenibacillus senegalensis]